MDKSSYLSLKQQQQSSVVSYQREHFCYKCVRLLRNCLCSLISPFQTNIHFVILMHPKEAKKEKIGTGRIAQLSLINSQIIVGVDFTENALVNTLIANTNNYCSILYPGSKAINISEDHHAAILKKKIESKQLVVFLIDGTWPCAKKMMRISKNLRALPRLSFDTKTSSIFEVKQQPAEFCLSTIESIHTFIGECNRVGFEETKKQEDQMIQVFKTMIDYQIQCSLDLKLKSYKKTKRGYSKKEDRQSPKKWLTRNIILID